MAENVNILEMKNVVYSFHTYGGEVKAVRDVSFEVRKGEILGIVGESGCGKSVTAQCIMRLNPEPPGFFEGGKILFDGNNVLEMGKKELRKLRGQDRIRIPGSDDILEPDHESRRADRGSFPRKNGCYEAGSERESA